MSVKRMPCKQIQHYLSITTQPQHYCRLRKDPATT